MMVVPMLVVNAGSLSKDDENFDKLTQDYLLEYFKASPITATWIGIHEYDAMLDDISPMARERRLQLLTSYKKKYEALNGSMLSPARNVDYRIILENLDEEIFGIEELREYEWNPMAYTGAVGNAIMQLITQEFAPLEQRLTNALARTKEVSKFLDQAKSNLQRSTKIHVQTAILQNKGNVSIFKEELPKAAEKASPDLKKEIERESEKAVAVLEAFGTWLETDLLPRASMNPRIGSELFKKKLQHNLKSNLSPEEILRRAEAEVQRVHRAMYTVAAPLHREYFGEPGSDTLAVIKAVLGKIVLDHPSAAGLMDSIRAIIPEIEKFVIEKDLLTLDPSQPLVIRETPKYERGVSVASLESPGPLEKNLKSFYNVTPIPPDWSPEQVESFLREYNNWSLRNLSIHEAIPGHYVQLYYSNRFPSVVRSVYGSGAMIEGWAVYTERMMVEQGFQNHDPRMKLINLKWYIRVVINAIIDQKIHAGTMTEQEAMDLMMKEGFQEEREAAGKWRRANLTSTQLSTYFVGFQEIWDLRKDYEKKVGNSFNLKQFHEAFLSFGSPSVKYIRAIMMENER